jgi:hypothetical protein
METFRIQLPYWKDLFAKYHLADDLQRAEHLLTSFSRREVIGDHGRVLETFEIHLKAQPKQGGSPDWSKAGREWSECAYCDGRGVVSDIPGKVVRRGEEVDRVYSFACVCDRGRFFAGMKVAEDWMLRFAADRKLSEIQAHEETLARFGIDPKADAPTRARQYRAAILRMKQQVGSGQATAKTARPNPPTTVEAARALMANRKPAKPTPPEALNPEALALAAYDNGDERNEWE